MVDFGAVIGDSAEWTKKVLFKPFNFKKWMILVFIAIMAGSMSNGMNFNSRNDRPYEHEQRQEEACAPAATNQGPCAGEMTAFWAVFIPLAVFVILILLLFMWLGSRFSFVFIEDVVKDDASVKKPFADNADVGNSYFRFNIAFMLILMAALLLFAGLGIFICYKMGLFTSLNTPDPDGKAIGEFLLVFIPFLLVFVLVMAAIGIFMTMLVDLALPIMYKDRIRTLEAIGKAWSLVKRNAANFIVYILIKIGLGIGASIAYAIVAVVSCIIAMIPVVLAVVALYFLSKALPAAAVLPFWVVVGVVLTPLVLFIFYCLAALNLPFAVFFRSMSMKFLEKLDSNYALIPSEKPVAAQQQ